MEGSQGGREQSALIGGSSQKNKSQMSSQQKSGNNIQNNSRRDKSLGEDGANPEASKRSHNSRINAGEAGDKSPMRSALNLNLDPA